ncbi:DUF397 domain-containing protein [Streptomyces sp. NPDC045369]|uniref:DUF397 domain-containing protein n=1 Tax=Streptomyces sp. NPDC045369 TaxID=3155732 RepID=UPI00340C45D5
MSYHKSSYSNPEHECVEVATNRPHIVAIRDSKRPTGPTLHVPPHRLDGVPHHAPHPHRAKSRNRLTSPLLGFAGPWGARTFRRSGGV